MDMRLSCNCSDDEGFLRDSPMSKRGCMSSCEYEVPVLRANIKSSISDVSSSPSSSSLS